MTQNIWFQTYNPTRTNPELLKQARLRLYCFHHAGSACQYFQPWANKLPGWIQLISVQLPGRWNRIQEPAFVHMDQLTPVIGEVFKAQLAEQAHQPYAFYGHSLGGLVAYELIRFLIKQKQRLPVHLFVSSKRAPPLHNSKVAIYDLPDVQFEQAITALYGGLPLEITSEPDMKQLFLAITKKDMELLDTYRYTPEPIINVPITILGGLNDKVITIKELQPWEGLTTASFEIRQFPGDHFFLRSSESEPAVINLITRTLEPYKPS